MADKRSKLVIDFDGDPSDLRSALRQLVGDSDRASKKVDGLNKKFDHFSKSGKAGFIAMGASLASVAVAGAAVGLSLAAIPLAMGGIAAVALHNNAQIQASFANLGKTVTSGMKDASGSMIDDLVYVGDSLANTFQRIQPQIKQMMNNSQQDVRMFSDGLTGLIENAMPGLVTMSERAQPAVAGLRDMLIETGKGTSDFFNAVSVGAPGAGSILKSLGTVVHSVLGFMGELLAKLANEGAPTFDHFAQTLDSTLAAISGMSGGALPVFLQSLEMVLNVMNGILGVLGPISGELGHVIGIMLSLSAALKIMQRAGSGFNSVSSKVKEFGTSVDGSGRKSRNFKGALSGLMGFMGGPAGIAVAALTLGLGALGERQQKAAERAQEHKEAVSTLTDILNKSGGSTGGAFTEELRNQAVASGEITLALDGAGVSVEKFTDAAIAGGPAWAEMRAQIQKGADAAGDWVGGIQMDRVDDYRKKIQEAAEAHKRLQDSTGRAAVAQTQSETSARQLSDAMQILKDETAGADSKTRALIDALNILNGENESADDAQQHLNDRYRETHQWLSENKTAIDKMDGAFVRNNGTIITATETGSKFRTFMQESKNDVITYTQAVFDQARAQGKSVPQALKASSEAFNSQITSLRNNMHQWGLSDTQINQVLSSMGLVPDQIISLMSLEGTDKRTIDEMKGVKRQFDRQPGKKDIYMRGLTKDAIALLQSLGFKVKTFPNGKTKITANTAGAKSTLDAFIQNNTGRVITIRAQVLGTAVKTKYGTMNPLGGYAKGAIVHPFAKGGFMPGGIGDIVKPNTFRLIGDNMTSDEAYIPLNGSSRSMSILEAAVSRMGRQLVPNKGGNVLTMKSASDGASGVTIILKDAQFYGVGSAKQFVREMRDDIRRLDRREGL